MKDLETRKDPQKALFLSLFPGLGFLYLENMKYFLMFMAVTFLPLLMISTSGNLAIIVSVLIYAIQIYYTSVLAGESLKNQQTYKKDPYYVLCLSFLLDGLGQIHLKQGKKGYIMMTFGMTSCISVWIFIVMKFGFTDFIMAEKGNYIYNLANVMIVWTIACIPIKFLSLVDAYYSTYHLYVAKKASRDN